MSLTMPRLRSFGGLAALSCVFLAIVQAGAARAAGRPDSLQAVFDCAKVAQDAARLACYDKAAGALNRAESTGEVVVVDKAQVGAARRQAFGFSLPSLALFGPKAEGEDADRLAVELKSAVQGRDGKWVWDTAEGATWRQTDDSSGRAPRPGAKMVIRKGALGSFFCSIDNQPGFRCVRSR